MNKKPLFLKPKYETPLLAKYGYQYVDGGSQRTKREEKHNFFMKWLNETYPHTYKDVKEGDCFIVWNGSSTPVPFIQLKDENPDKLNRPTRLLDGAYYGFPLNERICICTPQEAAQLKIEIFKNY